MRFPSLMSILAMAAVLTLAGLSQACPADERREEKPRMKGVELYSWKETTGDWVFVLLDGTNRAKTEKEVKQAKTRCKGIDGLKSAFATLAESEQVFWMHRCAGCDVPPKATRTAMAKAAKDANVHLHGVE